MKKLFLAWSGNVNCSTGYPHPKTGRMSKYGSISVFYTAKERDDFCNIYNNIYNMYPIATNKKDAKNRFFAGQSQEDFDMMLQIAEENLLN